MPRYLDEWKTAILRRARRSWYCHGMLYDAEIPGTGGATMRKRRHADGCAERIAKGEEYVESVAECPIYQSGPRYSIVCAARYVFGESPDVTHGRIAIVQAGGEVPECYGRTEGR